MIEPKSFENPKLKELIRVLMDWINDELHMERIIVQVRYRFQHVITNVHIVWTKYLNNLYDFFFIQDIEEDLYDGQILQKLMEKLTGEHLAVPEVTLSEEGQRSKLRVVLAFANKVRLYLNPIVETILDGNTYWN